MAGSVNAIGRDLRAGQILWEHQFSSAHVPAFRRPYHPAVRISSPATSAILSSAKVALFRLP